MKFGLVCRLALILLPAVLMVYRMPVFGMRGGAVCRVNVPYFSGDIIWALQIFP